jgi:DNA-directed RNA polymerase specialized sigma24 family protein
MNITELFERYDARLRATIARLGVTSPMDQEDIAQGVWAKLAARTSSPDSPADWIFAVARNDVFRHGRREGRRRAWSAAAAERRTAVSPRPFDIDQAVHAVRPQLSEREDEIMVAAMTSRTDRDLATTLGYPTVKVAQTVRARLRTRIRDILQKEVDVSFMYDLLGGHGLSATVTEPVSPPAPEAAALDPEPAEDPSANYAHSTLERVRAVETLATHAGEETEPSDWFGSYSEHFARKVDEEDGRALWATALGLPADEIHRLAAGRRTLLELDPDIAALAGMLLGIPVEDAVGLALADAGLRPVMRERGATLKEEILPAEEAAIRIRALRAEDEMLRA